MSVSRFDSFFISLVHIVENNSISNLVIFKFLIPLPLKYSQQFMTCCDVNCQCTHLSFFHAPLGSVGSKSKQIGKKKQRKKYYKTLLDTFFTDNDYRIRQTFHVDSKFHKYIHVETDSNGGASVLHGYIDELAKVKKEYVDEFVDDFLRLVFKEQKDGVSNVVMGIVHGAAARLPEPMKYLCAHHPNHMVVTEVLGKKSDLETIPITEFYQRVENTFHNGTYRAGPLNQFSLVGTVDGESGGLFPDILDKLEEDPFLYRTLPWGTLSALHMLDRKLSNDGPIMWVRPGEQMVPMGEVARSPLVKRRR